MTNVFSINIRILGHNEDIRDALGTGKGIGVIMGSYNKHRAISP